MTPWAWYLFVGAACTTVSDASVGLRPLSFHARAIIATPTSRKERNDSHFPERLRLQDFLSTRLRGGAVTTAAAPSDLRSVLIQPETLVSAGALLYTAQGACMFLSPERFCNALGMPNFCVGRLLMRILGNTMLHSGILMACFHVWHVDIATAIAISSIAFLVESLTEFLNEEPKKIGYKATFPALNFLVHFCIMVLGFCHSYLLAEILPFYAGYMISVSAIPMILAPRLWTRQLGFDIVDSKELYCVQAIGWLLANSGIMIAALSHGVNAVKSFGYGSIAMLVLSLKYTLQFVDLGVTVQWRFLHLFISTTLCAGTLFFKNRNLG